MSRYADPRRCPDCRQPLTYPLVTCTSCGLPLIGPDATELFATLTRADQLLARLRSAPINAPAGGVPPAQAASRIPGDSYPLPSTAGVPVAARSSIRDGIAGLSVQRILLGLGALCLLVAALTFLIVAWSFLGVGGRTAVLVALTLAAASLGWLLARRGLRTAAEALLSVAFGLLALDLFGADDAGWFSPLFGDLTTSGVFLLVGSPSGFIALATAFAMRTKAELIAPQAVAVIALMVAAAALVGTLESDNLAALTASALFLALSQLTRHFGLRYVPWPALAAAALWWLILLTLGVFEGLERASLRGLWLEGQVWPLVAAAALAAIASVVPWLPALARVGSVSAAATIGTFVAILPTTDESPNVFVLGCLAGLLVWGALLAWLQGSRWTPAVAYAPLLLTGLAPILAAGWILAAAAASVLEKLGDEQRGVWVGGIDVRHVATASEVNPFLAAPIVAALIVVGLLLALGGWQAALVRARAWAMPILAALMLALVASTALYAVPVALLVVGLLAVVALLAWWAHREGQTLGYGAAGVVGLAALITSLPSDWLTAAVLVPAVGGSAIALRGDSPIIRRTGQALLPLSSGALLWTAAELGSIDVVWRAAPVLVCVGLLAVARPRVALEISAAVVALLGSAASVLSAVDTASALAIHLTLAGALVTASSLANASRRLLGWVGGLLLAMATWVRLWDLGVEAPEAYTMPSALALLAVGLWHLRAHPEASTRLALGPALALATVPSLLKVFAEPISLRAALLGVGCLALVLVGVRLRWSMPVVIGALVGGTLVLWEAAPYTGNVPPWVLIGLAGAALIGVGVTWEARLRNAQSAAAYVARLR